jgi:hypothetical protein
MMGSSVGTAATWPTCGHQFVSAARTTPPRSSWSLAVAGKCYKWVLLISLPPVDTRCPLGISISAIIYVPVLGHLRPVDLLAVIRGRGSASSVPRRRNLLHNA